MFVKVTMKCEDCEVESSTSMGGLGVNEAQDLARQAIYAFAGKHAKCPDPECDGGGCNPRADVTCAKHAAMDALK